MVFVSIAGILLEIWIHNILLFTAIIAQLERKHQ